MDQLSRKGSSCLFDEFPLGEVAEGLTWFSRSAWQKTATLCTSAHHDLRLLRYRNNVEASDEVL